MLPRHLPGWLCLPPQYTSTTVLPTLSLSFSFSLRGIHMYYRGLDLPPLPRCTPHSLLSLFVSVTQLALVSCHLIFSHPPHTRPPTKRHQSHHPIPISDLPIPAHLTHESCLVFPSPHLYLTSPCLYPLPSSPHSHVLRVGCHATPLVRPVSFLDSAFQ